MILDSCAQRTGRQLASRKLITPRLEQRLQHHFEAAAGTGTAHLVRTNADLGTLAQASPADLCRCLLQGSLAAATPIVTCQWVPALQASASA